jgi:ATP-dependent Clp protease ATP-binding subunit ClpA
MDDVIAQAREQSLRLGHNYIGTEHVLLAIVDRDPSLLAKYGVSYDDLKQAVTGELVRIVGELHGARSIVDSVRQTAEQQMGVQLPQRASSPMTPRFAGILERARSTGANDVLVAIIDEDSNLAVIVLERLGVPLEDLRRHVSGGSGI